MILVPGIKWIFFSLDVSGSVESVVLYFLDWGLNVAFLTM